MTSSSPRNDRANQQSHSQLHLLPTIHSASYSSSTPIQNTQPQLSSTTSIPTTPQLPSPSAQLSDQNQQQRRFNGSPIQNKPWSRTSTQTDLRSGNNDQNLESFDGSFIGSSAMTMTWTQRLNNIAHQRQKSQGFIWDSLDSSMEDLQIARNTRKNGPIRLITKRQDTSYNGIRSTLRLQYAEKRKSDLRNLVSSIRLSLDYDLYKARAMALLNSKARTIFWIMMDLVVDVLFCVLYLVDAQSLVNSRNEIDYNNPEYPNPPYLFVPRLWQVWVIAVAMSTWNLMSALIRFIFADNKLRFIFSFQTLLDAITAIPFLLSGFFLPYGQFLYVPYFLRSWSVISRLQRALSIGVDIGISDQPFDPVKAKLIGLVAYFIVILYNGMAAFLYCETMFTPKTENAHTVWDALYFILITASTVGYGDITPKSLEARIVVMIFIIVALSVVPGLIAGAIDTIKSSRSGGGSYIQSRSANGAIRQYLVMIGDFQSAKRVADMLNGFFNKEFSDNDVRVVFLSRNKPSKDVRTLLDMPSHKNRTTILVGNGLDESDLKRCQAKDAAGVFIIPDLTVSRKESQDTMTTLLAWSLHLHAPKTRIFTYNLLPETETFQWGIAEQTICISEVKQLLLAYSCRHRGTTTLILNLLYPSEPSNNYEDGWQAQYGDGTGNEIYTGPVPTVFVGWTFAQVSWFVFQEFQTILIGVDIFLQSSSTFIGMDWDGPHLHAAEGVSTDGISSNGSSKSHTRSRSPGRGFHNHESDRGVPSGKYHLTLNPGNSYRLGKYDHLVFIAQSPIDVESITKFTVDQYERLVRDEKGHLSESRNDFAYAMDMYYNLRETRTLARAAATKRANHRKDKKAKQAEMSLKTSMVNNYQKSQGFSASEKSLSSSHAVGIGEAGVRISTPPGRSIPSFRSKSGGFKKSRPAWNVALYDDDDDEDGESEESDSNNLKKIRGDQSRFSHHSSQSRNSNRSKGIKQDREPPMSALSREELITKTEPEEIPLSDTKEWSNPLSIYGQVHKNEAGSGNDGEQGSRNRMSRQFLSTSPPFEDKFYPTDYDRNAAAAAAEDAKNQEEQGISEEEQLDELTSPSIPAFNSNNLSAAVSPRLGVSIVTSELHGGSNSNIKDPFTPESSRMSASSNVRPALTPLIPNSQLPTFSQSASIHGSYKTLDESTYIGQTSVTRSETKDLPLCHLLLNPPDSIKPLLKDDLSNLKDHIVVCSDAGENLYRFLATLRLAQISREDLKTIVILTRNPIETFASDTRVVNDTEGAFDQGDDVFGNTANIGGNSATEGSLENCYGGYWDAILAFPRIYWVSGNCRHQRDLVRAGILGASSIVIMSHSVEGLDRDEFADSTAIMAHHMVSQILHQRGLLGRQNIVVDISERSNIRFLNMRNLNKINPSNNNSGKASNKTISNISRIGNGSSNNSFWMTPTFASGQVLVSSLLDNILFQSYSKTHILDLIKLCCGVRFKQAIELDQILGIDCSNICLIDCPVEYIGKSFLKLYQGLALLYGIIPLGLYRAPDFELNNAMPFVFSNPLPGIIVKGTDKIYVLKS